MDSSTFLGCSDKAGISPAFLSISLWIWRRRCSQSLMKVIPVFTDFTFRLLQLLSLSWPKFVQYWYFIKTTHVRGLIVFRRISVKISQLWLQIRKNQRVIILKRIINTLLYSLNHPPSRVKCSVNLFQCLQPAPHSNFLSHPHSPLAAPLGRFLFVYYAQWELPLFFFFSALAYLDHSLTFLLGQDSLKRLPFRKKILFPTKSISCSWCFPPFYI